MNDLLYALVSVGLTLGILVFIKQIIQKKLEGLDGSNKLFGIVYIGVVLGEVVFLGTKIGFFDFAIEAITSIGATAVILGIAFQNQLKNSVAGISLFLNSQINVGDLIEFEYIRATVIAIHLTKVVALTDDGLRVYIPNHKFSEEMVMVFPKQPQKNKVEKYQKVKSNS